jgi:glycerol-3-phosphate cytidylyltransferase
MARVYVDGVFDLFHYGHVNLLRQARALGTTLVVGVVADADAALYKRTPVLTQAERLAVVRGCRYADEVIPAQLVLDEAFLRRHQIDVVVHGDDSTQTEFYAAPLEMGIMQYLPYTTTVSTTEILARIRRAPASGAEGQDE